MKKYSIIVVVTCLFSLFSTGSCDNFPVDEDGLLVTERTDCYVGSFDMYGTDHQTILAGNAYVDTLEQVIIAYVRFGAPVNHVWPRFSLCSDAKLDPKVTSWVDFTPSKLTVEFTAGDWASGYASTGLSARIIANRSAFPSSALKYTVISGNRKIRKEYTVLVVERPMQ
ncbi:MAG: hypothetical protein LBL57_07720 [Tannerella sp.]|jgi:hypothetical protein|nr:hypothetical protein [Tannerella sp.]